MRFAASSRSNVQTGKQTNAHFSSFENSLVDDLNYNGFYRMRRIFDRVLEREKPPNHKFQLVLDVGCGTGLAGEVVSYTSIKYTVLETASSTGSLFIPFCSYPIFCIDLNQFRNISSTLVGIDISPKIIQQAKQLHPVYDDYKIGDVREVLLQFPKTVSLLVAADTFIYFNDLSQLFATMRDALEKGGLALFSLENVSKENEKRLLAQRPEWRWQITPSGRISHRKKYVEAVAAENSFEVVLYENLDGFRREKNVDVPGHFFVLKKVSGKDEL